MARTLAAALICALSCAACSTLAPDSSPALRQLADGPQKSALQAQLFRFYAARDFRPAWTGSEEARARAASALFVLQHADRQGLRPTDYRVDAEAGAAHSDVAASYDMRLTQSLLRYAGDVRLGRVAPKAVYDDAALPAPDFDAAAELEAAIEDDRIDAFLAELPPQDPQYRALAGALVRYRAVAAKGGWQPLSRQSAPQTLGKRLALEDVTLAKGTHPSAADLTKALKRFQLRHGLPDDGVLGGETLKALNVPVFERIAEIAANMERWRWLPRQLEEKYIRVDVPDQSVDFIENGKSVLHSKAIIGRDGQDRTPILRTLANAIVVNPPWNIPDDIAAKAILPHLRKDPNYLATRNMVLVGAPDPSGAQIDWRAVKADNLPYQIRQQPGPHNVLGALMLDMPNAFDVYLHGAANESLFDLKNRERSHGCVRVQNVVSLAALALKGSIPNPDDTLSRQIASGETQRLPLVQPVPVYMLYWTATVGKDGAASFRPDRYERDPPLIARLTAPWREKAVPAIKLTAEN